MIIITNRESELAAAVWSSLGVRIALLEDVTGASSVMVSGFLMLTVAQTRPFLYTVAANVRAAPSQENLHFANGLGGSFSLLFACSPMDAATEQVAASSAGTSALLSINHHDEASQTAATSHTVLFFALCSLAWGKERFDISPHLE